VIPDRFLISQRVRGEETKASCLNLHLTSIVWNISAIPGGIKKDKTVNVGIINQQEFFLCRTVEGNFIGVSGFVQNFLPHVVSGMALYR